MDIIRIIIIILSLIMLGLTGYWFYLALFDRTRFSRLMSERVGLRVSEQAQYYSALILFPLMLVAVIALVVSLLAR